MSSASRYIAGIHGPNSLLADVRIRDPFSIEPDGADAFWRVVKEKARARWIKFFPSASPQDVMSAKADGMRVILRAEGEGLVSVGQVKGLLTRYAGLIDVIECGNEPTPCDPFPDPLDFWWNHAQYMQSIWEECADQAYGQGCLLATPGWQGNQTLDWMNTVDPSGQLYKRVHDVYARYPVICIHIYDPFALVHRGTDGLGRTVWSQVPNVSYRLHSWISTFNPRHDSAPTARPDQRFIISELGIADISRVRGEEKANNYADLFEWVADAYPEVMAGTVFIGYGTASNSRFSTDSTKYDPHGTNGYWLTEGEWEIFGDRLWGP